ncbi:hypothetical protein [Marinitenerispora sediminis]|uniref:hypothetical protein n=1 Tax=Marinitenerispora sediminis TaxID=1931232 RepID=UPI0011C0376B|nr:hypothetical protein [Marinitenerispora sediminis]
MITGEHRSPSYATFFYAGHPSFMMPSAIYRPGASEMLVRRFGAGQGWTERTVAVPPVLSREEFSRLARDHGALENMTGTFRSPAVGEVAYSDAGSVLVHHPEMSQAGRPRGDGVVSWGRLPVRPGRGDDFAESARANFNVLDAHRRPTGEERAAVAAWLTEETGSPAVAEYLGVATAEPAATGSAPETDQTAQAGPAEEAANSAAPPNPSPAPGWGGADRVDRGTGPALLRPGMVAERPSGQQPSDWRARVRGALGRGYRPDGGRRTAR